MLVNYFQNRALQSQEIKESRFAKIQKIVK